MPGRGFLLNNELTDFTAVYDDQDPNRIEPGKRPRSSMSPTIILRHGKPFMALGSPGGSTIITTVLQLILNRIDRGMPLPQAMADPRGSQRNTAAVSAEPAFIDRYGARLEALGHKLTPAGDRFTSAAEIGAATAIGSASGAGWSPSRSRSGGEAGRRWWCASTGRSQAVLRWPMTDQDSYTVERTAVLRAEPERIYEEVEDFHRWPAWSPWEDIDPEMERTYSGPGSGGGATYAWSGNRKAGRGRMEIAERTRPRAS